MLTLSDTLTTLATKIMFVSANQPGGGGGTTVPQTGDIIGMALFIIAAIAIVGVGAFFAFSRLRSTENQSDSTVAKTKTVGIALTVVALISLLGALFCYTPLGKAFAQDKVLSADTIYAYVDEQTGAITFEDNYLLNDSAADITVASTQVAFGEEVASIEGIKDIQFGIHSGENVLFAGDITLPGEEPAPFTPTQQTMLKVGDATPIQYSLENCSKELAVSLIGKTVFTTGLNESECQPVSLSYEASIGGVLCVDGNPVPDVTEYSQSVQPLSGNPKAVEAQGTGFLYWQKTDGTKISEDVSFVPPRNEQGLFESAHYVAVYNLDAPSKEATYSPNGPVTINYVYSTGGICSITSETLQTETSTPKGSKAYAGKGFIFDHWNNANGEEVSCEATFVPKPGADGKYVSTTYTCIFRYNLDDDLCFNIDFASGNSGYGTVSSSYVLAIKNPVYTYTVNGAQVTIASSTGSKSFTVWAKPNTGFTFSNWKLVDASGHITDPAVGATNITSNMKFVAHFAQATDTYTQEFSTSAGGKLIGPSTVAVPANTTYAVDGNTVKFNDAAKTTVTASPVSSDYVFTKWVIDPDNNGIVKSNASFKAQFKYVGGDLLHLSFNSWSDDHGATLNYQELDVPYETNYKWHKGGLNNGNVTFFDDEGTVLYELEFSNIDEGYYISQWQYWDQGAHTTVVFEEEGKVYESMDCFFVAEEHVVTLTYQVSAPNLPQGQVELNNDSSSTGAVVTEQVSKLDKQFVGAYATEWDEDMNMPFVSEWNNWTVQGFGVKWTPRHLDPAEVKKIAMQIWDEVGWCDLTFEAHFISAKALYNPTTSNLTFVYDEGSHDEINGANYKFGVKNTHYADWENGDESDMVFPSWCYSDGTPKVNATSVTFDKSFKNFKNLRSTSMWFMSGDFANYLNNDKKKYSDRSESAFELLGQTAEGWGTYAPRYITSISGLENVYTENLEEAAYMFASNPNSDTPLNDLDFSTWNTPLLKNAQGMFMGNAYLKEIKFPPSGGDVEFGGAIENMSRMFYGLYTLPNIHLTNNFGAVARDMSSMFEECHALSYVNVDNEGGIFGGLTEDMSFMFYNCENLRSLNINGLSGSTYGFGANAYYGYEMFCNCYNLRKLDLTCFSTMHDGRSDFDYMLENCYSLTEITMTYKWQMPFKGMAIPEMIGMRYPWHAFYSNVETVREQVPIPSSAESRPLFTFEEINKMLTKVGARYTVTFRQETAKALYQGKTLTFVYDYIEHPNVEKEFIVTNTGLVGSSTELEIGTLKLANKGNKDLSALNVFISDGVIADFEKLESYHDYAGYDAQAKIYNLFPEWYDVVVDSTGEVTIKCNIDASTVVFDQSFRNYEHLTSMAFWFCADSFGYQPFTTFSGLWTNVPTYNLQSVLCTFGGISYEAIIDEAESYSSPWGSGTLSSTWKPGRGTGVPAVVKPSHMINFLDGIYFSDSYGTSIRSLDFGTTDEASYSIFGIENWSGAFANATALQSITFPKQIWDEYDSRYYGTYIWNANSMFLNCSNLTTINNVNEFITYEMDTCCRMFKGCNSLKSLDLSKWDTTDVDWGWDYIESDGTIDFDYSYCYDMFVGCNSLQSLTLGYYWTLPCDFAGLVDNWFEGDETTDKYAWTYTEDNQHKHTYEIPTVVREWDSEFGYYYCHAKYPGTYTRDKRYIDQFNLSFKSNNTDFGTVSPSGENVAQYSDYAIYYNTEEHGLKVGTNMVTATPKDGYKFDFWSVEFDDGTSARVNDVDCYTAFMIERLILERTNYSYHFKKYYDYTYSERLSILLKQVSVMRDTSAVFTAHFTPVDYTPKAVYVKDTNINGAKENALIMYYDNLDHSAEGTVFDLTQETGYISKNLITDQYNQSKWTSGVYGNYVSSCPPWYSQTYDYYYQQEKVVWEVVEKAAKTLVAPQVAVNLLPHQGLNVVIADPDMPQYAPQKSYAGYRYQYKCLVDASSVIFDDSFANYENLKSISMWFMADSDGYQPFKNFYSRDEAGNLTSGFSNVNTTSLSDVSYAFGGYIDGSYMDKVYPGHQQQAQWAESKKKERNLSAFDVLENTLQATYDDGYWGGAYQSYGNSIVNLDLSTLDLSHTKDWSYMLANAVGLQEVTFPDNVNRLQPTNMEGLFYNCESLGLKSQPGFVNPAIINLDKFNTSAVTNMDYMFYGCSHLVSLDLSSFDTSSIVSAHYVEQVQAPAAETDSPNKGDDYWTKSAYEMFTQCYRLVEFKTNSVYNRTKDSRIDGWELNMGLSGLTDFDDNLWLNVNGSKTYELESFEIPVNIEDTPSSSNIRTGVFTRESVRQETVSVTPTKDEETGEVLGTLNGEENIEYGFINDATIQVDSTEPDVMWIDNVRIQAEPKEGYRFKYWKTGEDFTIEGDTQFADMVVPMDHNQTIEKGASGDRLITTYPIVAVFVPDTDRAKALFYANSSRQGVFKFVYDNEEHVVNKERLESDTSYVLAAVYDVNPHTSDYDLPSWYKVRGQSWHTGDNHNLPAFDSIIELKVTGNQKITIEFDETMKNYDELTSLSCWFSPAIGNDEKLFDPFDLADIRGWENVVTDNIVNVKYMFGGHEFFSDYHGNKQNTITLDGFNAAKLRNFDGMFANCRDMETLILDDSFNDAVPTSMKYTFYNCQKFIGNDLTKALAKFNTSEVRDMSFMLGMYSEVDPEQEDVLSTITYNFPESWDMRKVESLSGFFAGRNDVSTIKLTGHFDTSQSDAPSNLKNISGMFKDCSWLTRIDLSEIEGHFSTYSVTDVSYLFANCKHLETSECFYDYGICHYYYFIPGYRVTNYSYMFYGCESLKYAEILKESAPYGGVDVTNAIYMFGNCTSLETLYFDRFYINDEAAVRLDSGTYVVPYYNMFMNYDGVNAYPNDSVKYLYISDESSYDWNTEISMSACGMATNYNDTGKYVLWMKDGVQNNYLTSELGLYVYDDYYGYTVLNGLGYFERAVQNASFGIDSASRQEYRDVELYTKYRNPYWGEDDYSSTSYTDVGWSENSYSGRVIFGPATEQQIGLDYVTLTANQAMLYIDYENDDNDDVIYVATAMESQWDNADKYGYNANLPRFTDWTINGQRVVTTQGWGTGKWINLDALVDEDGNPVHNFNINVGVSPDAYIINNVGADNTYSSLVKYCYWESNDTPADWDYGSSGIWGYQGNVWEENSYNTYYLIGQDKTTPQFPSEATALWKLSESYYPYLPGDFGADTNTLVIAHIPKYADYYGYNYDNRPRISLWIYDLSDASNQKWRMRYGNYYEKSQLLNADNQWHKITGIPDGDTVYRNFNFYASYDFMAPQAAQAQSSQRLADNVKKGDVVQLPTLDDEAMLAKVDAIRAEREQISAIEQLEQAAEESESLPTVSGALRILSWPIPITFFSFMLDLII